MSAVTQHIPGHEPLPRRETIPFTPTQPTPRAGILSKITTAETTVTAISRSWSPGDAETCRLCPRGHCTFNPESSSCLILVAAEVEGDELLFRPDGLAPLGGGCYTLPGPEGTG